MKRKICVITGTRADYGHLYWLLKEIQSDQRLTLQLVATGMHLSARFGSTYKMIESDGFKITQKVPILKYANTALGVTQSIGEGCKLFARVYAKIKPDVVVILGDRFEMLAAAVAAHMARIPIAHIHGGESTQGAIDEAIRHSITKMSNLHFPVTAQYKNRIKQMGENPSYIFNYGAPGLDHMTHMDLLSKKELECMLDFQLTSPVAMVTFHPETLSAKSPEDQIKGILGAISRKKLRAIFTQANADPLGHRIDNIVRAFCRKDPAKYNYVQTLGQKKYFSCLQYVDLMIGNSSSGIIESPSFHLPVVNVGERQAGRVRSQNVIDVGYSVNEIERGITKALGASFKSVCKKLSNPYAKYHDGKISYRIKEILKSISLNGNLIKKKFYDIHQG